MKLRGIEFGTIVETQKKIRKGKSIIKWGAGVVLREQEYPKLGFSDCCSGSDGKKRGLFLCLPFPENDDYTSFTHDIEKMLSDLVVQDVPVIVQLSIFVPPKVACAIARNPRCDAIMVLDEIPWKDFPEEARQVFFRTQKSPFAKSGGGYISGKYLNSFTAEWIRQCRRDGLHKPIIAGGGVLRPRDVEAFSRVGASAIGIESARRLRPWNVRRIIHRAQELFKNTNQ